MKNFISVTITILLSLLVLQSCRSNDDDIKQMAEAAIASTAPDVSATVEKRVVTLEGTVNSEQIRLATERAVRGVKDVRKVINNVKVVSPVITDSDDLVKRTIQSALGLESLNYVKLEVKNGNVMLTGDVPSEKEMTKIVQIVNQASGVKKVDNQLVVKDPKKEKKDKKRKK